VSAVGSGVVALRLRQADLPIEPVVALMSAEHRFAVGAGILAAPLLAATIGFLVDWLGAGRWGPDRADEPDRPRETSRVTGTEVDRTHQSESKGPPPDRRLRRERQVVAAGAILVGGGIVGFLLKLPLWTLAFELVCVIGAVSLVFHFLSREPEKRYTFDERLVVFLSVLTAAGVGAIVAESFRTPSFDEAEITLRDQRAAVTGGYITSTEQSVVLSTRCEVIEAVPRDQIMQIRVGPGEVTRTDC
jgi:hypothetical protein